MITLIPTVISVLSLSVSCYTLYHVRKPRVKPIERARQAAPKTQPEPTKFLSKEDRREQIAERAYDPELQVRLAEIKQRLRDGSGLIAAHPDAQSNQVDWRRRNAR